MSANSACIQRSQTVNSAVCSIAVIVTEIEVLCLNLLSGAICSAANEAFSIEDCLESLEVSFNRDRNNA